MSRSVVGIRDESVSDDRYRMNDLTHLSARICAPHFLVLPVRLDPPESSARRILDAVARDRSTVYPRGPERVFALVQRMLPSLIDRQLTALADGLRRSAALVS